MVRTTIYLDDQMRERLQRIVPARRLNRFINEAVAEKVAALEQQHITQAMKEGYLATNQDRVALDEDWAAVDLQNWPQ